MKLDIFIHRNITEWNTAMMKITININANIPTLMQPTPTHYEHCLLCMVHTYSYDRQTSCSTFTVTATSCIQVTKNSDLRVETASPYEGHTSHPFFLQLPHRTSGLLYHTSGLPKILHWLRLTLLMTLALWGAAYK